MRTGYFTCYSLSQNINDRRDRTGPWAVGLRGRLDADSGSAMISFGNSGKGIESLMGNNTYLTGALCTGNESSDMKGLGRS